MDFFQIECNSNEVSHQLLSTSAAKIFFFFAQNFDEGATSGHWIENEDSHHYRCNLALEILISVVLSSKI